MARNIEIVIGARDKASKVLSRIGRSVSDFGRRMATIARNVAKGFAAIAAGALAAGAVIHRIVSGFAEAGDAIHKMSLRTKLSAEFLSELAFAAEQSGTDIDQVGQAIFRMFRRIGNSETATGPAVRALKELGLSADDLKRHTPEQLFFKITDALNGVQDPLRRSQLGFELLGDNWRQIAPLLESGSDEIRRLMNEARELGRTMSTEDVAAAAKYQDAMNKLKSVMTGIRNDIAVKLLPALTDFAEQFSLISRGFTQDVGQMKIAFVDFQLGLLKGFQRLQQLLPNFGINRAAGAALSGAISGLEIERQRSLEEIMKRALGRQFKRSGSDQPGEGGPGGGGAGEITGWHEVRPGKKRELDQTLHATDTRLLAGRSSSNPELDEAKKQNAKLQAIDANLQQTNGLLQRQIDLDRTRPEFNMERVA